MNSEKRKGQTEEKEYFSIEPLLHSAVAIPRMESLGEFEAYIIENIPTVSGAEKLNVYNMTNENKLSQKMTDEMIKNLKENTKIALEIVSVKHKKRRTQ